MRIVKMLLVAAGLAVTAPAAAESHAAFPDVASPGRPVPAPSTAPAPVVPPPPVAPAAPVAPTYDTTVPRQPLAYSATSFGGAPASGSFSPPPSSPGFGVGGSWSSGGFSFGSTPSEPSHDLPSGYALEEGPATTPLVIGGIVLALPYATGLGIGASQGFENGSGWLAAPGIGPWLALGARRDPCEGANDKQHFDSDVGKCVAEPLIRGMLVLDGVLQAAGGVLLVVGATSHETRMVKKQAPHISAAPATIGKSGYGVAVAGQF